MEKADRFAEEVKDIMISAVCDRCDSRDYRTTACPYCDIDETIKPRLDEMMGIIVGSS